jgi:hypothetical protein
LFAVFGEDAGTAAGLMLLPQAINPSNIPIGRTRSVQCAKRWSREVFDEYRKQYLQTVAHDLR